MADKPTDSGPERFSAYIVIPANIYFDKDLKDRDKMLYGLLSCMSNERGYAFPRNETLQKYLGGVSEDTVSRTLKRLTDAGAILIEGGAGGSPKNIRKIYLGAFCPDSLRKSADPSLRKSADPSLRKSADPIINCNNEKRKNNTRASEEELNSWIASWGAGLGYPMEITTPLIADFFAFLESRKAKGKPFLTVRAVSMQGDRLKKNTAEYEATPTERVARMRYMLQSAIDHNWERVYPIGAQAEQDYYNWRKLEYRIPAPSEGLEEQDWF